MIRLATIADIDRIVELGSRSLVDGPYAGEKDNPEQTRKLAEKVILEIGRVLLWEENGVITGFLAFIIYDHYFTAEKMAQELVWYCIPESRAGGSGLKLMWAAERMAKELGAVKFQFTAPNEIVGDIYKRFGYTQLEVAYQKDLNKCHF